MDILFINPNSSTQTYQGLSKDLSAIETPTWALLLAQSCRARGSKVGILDCLAENLTINQAFKRIEKLQPKLICFVVYGQNVNAGSTNMEGSIQLSRFIKEQNTFKSVISFVGSHVQALPKKTMEEERSIDFIFINEGVYSLHSIISNKYNFDIENLSKIDGIAYRKKNNKIEFTKPSNVVPQEKMDEDLPGYAWDLLPYNIRPLDLYRAPLWHAEYNEEYRTPYAAIQTSLGCQFKCDFCMINIVNKNDNEEIGIASNYNKMRFWSTNFIIKEFDNLISMGVKTIKITDEMFLLNPKYYLPLCDLLSKRNQKDDLKMWAYSRIDTVKRPEVLNVVRKAGIKWLCLGIESGNKKIRLEVSKGKFEDVDVEKIVKQIESADINVLANYIYGLPGDTKESIKETFNLSLKLNTLGWNTYAAMALPGSMLYYKATKEGTKLPSKYSEFSFHSYDSLPLPTSALKASEVLALRDEYFIKYFSSKKFLDKVQSKFGEKALENIKKMLSIKLKRKIIEENT